MSRTSVGRDFVRRTLQEQGLKQCSRCDDPKPLEDFYAGGSSQCKACTKARMQANRAANPERHKAQLRVAHYRRNYGLTPEQADAMKAQGCALCGKKTGLHIDHDHNTGRVRGVLCTPHNTAIGALGDSVEGLMAAAAYLLTTEDVLADV